MSKTTSDVMVETLMNWGVEVIFGIPGDGINGIMESLRKQKDRIKFVQVRHEEAAAFAACAYAKFTGKLGVCLATSGPGGIHLLNGLYDAKMDGASVLAITGMQYHDLINTHTQQDVELDKLYMDVCVYNERCMGPRHIENITELACRKALAYRGVSHICLPVDIQDLTLDDQEPSKRNLPHHTSDLFVRGTRLPDEGSIRAAAKILDDGKKVAMLIGRGAIGCADELEELAEKLGAPIAKALLGKMALPDESAYCAGPVGLLGSAPSQDALMECDVLLMVGTSFPYIEFLPKPGKVKCVQIDNDPARIGLRYPTDVGLVGDAKKTLQMLTPKVKAKKDRSFLTSTREKISDWWDLMEKRGTNDASPMKPQVVAWELGKRLADDAIISCDSGTIATWFARYIPIRRGQMCTLSGNLATMACGLPYTIGAQIAFPQRQCVAFVGDGGLTMLMGELATAVKYRLPIKVFVINNHTLGQIKWEQMVFLGNPEYGCDLQAIDFAMVAKACGATGLTLTEAADAPRIIEEALTTPGPVLVDCIVDANEPPMPAHIKAEQAAHFAEAMLRGEPYRGDIIKTVLKDKIRELI
jgi:pyruvate dehydrogenase (quinone)/pyruvate oxidase